MIRPAPGTLTAILSVARFALLRHLRSRRSIIALVALALVIGAVGFARKVGHASGAETWTNALDVTLLSFACYIVPFLFHTSSFSEEHADRTLTYLLIRPVSRTAIVLGKYLAGSAMVVGLNALATLVLFGVSFAGDFASAEAALLGRALLSVTLLGLGHSAIAATWSAVTPEQATPMTVVHFTIGEFGLRHLPSILPLFSLHHLATEIAQLERGSWAESSPALPLAGDVGVMLGWTAFYLAFASILASAREYRFAKA